MATDQKEYIEEKKLQPIALSSAEWEAMSREFREASFWIAGQEQVAALAVYRKAAAMVAAGDVSSTEVRRAVRAALAAANYMPADFDDVGTFRDIRTPARMEFIIRTNVEMAAGYARHKAFNGSLSHPAQRLVRMGYRQQPRDWEQRWRIAYGSLPPGEREKACATDMVARNDCLIWQRLSRFDQPYPPFDYNSGMVLHAVTYSEAVALGIAMDGYGDGEQASFASDARKPDLSGLTAEQAAELKKWMAAQ